MKYITKFEAEQRAEQLEKRFFGFGDDQEKEKMKAEAEDSRSSSARLETRNDFKNESDALKFKFKLKSGKKYKIGGRLVTVSGNNFGDWGENYNARWFSNSDSTRYRVGTLVMYADGRIELNLGGNIVSEGNNGLGSMSEVKD